MNDNTSGRRWARFTLALSLLASMVGNVTHTALAESVISLWLRVPAAVVWPLFTFLGIEVLVRMVWERSFTHHLARNLVIMPAVPAAVVSYEHLYSLLLMMGERWVIAIIGPLAIDGALIGCTVALLVTRSLPSVPPSLPSVPPSLPADVLAEDMGGAAVEEAERILREAREELPAPVEGGGTLPSTRRGRASSYDVVKVVHLMLEGASTDAQIASLPDMPSVKTLERVRRAVRTLRTDPHAEIPSSWKVSPSVVDVIRREVNK